MSKLTTQFQKLLRKLRDFFPTYLPITEADYRRYSQTLLADYGYPVNPVTEYALGQFVLHLKEGNASPTRRSIMRKFHKQWAAEWPHKVVQQFEAEVQAYRDAARAKAIEEAKAKIAATQAELAKPKVFVTETAAATSTSSGAGSGPQQ